MQKKKKNLQTINFIIFRDSLIFNQIFLSPQVEWCTIITYKHCIYELPHNLPNDLRLKGLRKSGNISKDRIIAHCLVSPPKWKLSPYYQKSPEI